MVALVQAFAQQRPIWQAVGQGDRTQSQTQACTDQAGCGVHIDGTFDDRVEQQDRKEEKIHQRFNRLPHRSVQGRVAANQVAAQDEGEVGEEQLSEVHTARITARGHFAGGVCHLGAQP